MKCSIYLPLDVVNLMAAPSRSCCDVQQTLNSLVHRSPPWNLTESLNSMSGNSLDHLCVRGALSDTEL